MRFIIKCNSSFTVMAVLACISYRLHTESLPLIRHSPALKSCCIQCVFVCVCAKKREGYQVSRKLTRTHFPSLSEHFGQRTAKLQG